MLARTGSHRSGVGRRMPEMRRIVEFNCASTSPVWAERHHTVTLGHSTRLQSSIELMRMSGECLHQHPSFSQRASLAGCSCSSICHGLGQMGFEGERTVECCAQECGLMFILYVLSMKQH